MAQNPPITFSKFILIAAAITAAVGIGAYLLGRDQGSEAAFTSNDFPNDPPPERATVRAVIDPITIELDTGHIVRYLGVRAPETTSQVQCFGKEATKANESTIGKLVRLEEDPILSRSQDGAWVRYVYMEVEKESPQPSEPEGQDTSTDTPEETGITSEISPTPESEPSVSPTTEPEESTTEEIFINERILEGGFAFPVVSEDMKYGDRMLSAARFASATGKGLWGQCEVKDENGTLQTQKIEDCVIKGKVTSNFQKLYRTPECSAYAQTTVIESQGGRWFCAEDIAQDAGFTKAPDCN